MDTSPTFSGRWFVVGVVGLAVVLMTLVVVLRDRIRPPVKPTITPPATMPAAAPTTPLPATQPAALARPRNLNDILKRTHPQLMADQPAPGRLPLSRAPRYVIDAPVHLDAAGHLWIADSQADPLPVVLERAPRQTTHIAPLPVRYVHRYHDGNDWRIALVVVESDGTEALTDGRRATNLDGHRWDWPRAFSWQEKIVVPSDRGVAVIELVPRTTLRHHALLPADAPPTPARPQVLRDERGLLAWVPWEAGEPGGFGAARYRDGNWETLGPSQGWPERIVHLVPLVGGSVIQLAVNDSGDVEAMMSHPEAPKVDEAEVEALVHRLSDPDPDKRQAAHQQLTRYGAGAWPVFERTRFQVGPEARLRLEELLASRLRPQLGGVTLEPGPLTVVARFNDGGALMLAEAGGLVTRPDHPPRFVAPVWLSIKPGLPIQQPSRFLVHQILPGHTSVHSFADEWVLSEPVIGPRRFMGNHFVPLLTGEDRVFSRLIGIDSAGRWLFQRETDASQTLVFDPNLPDLTPRLPVWLHHVPQGVAGWDQSDWPALQAEGAWALHDRGWQAAQGKVAWEVQSVPATAPDALLERDGVRYTDGVDQLIASLPDGTQQAWDLPDAAQGTWTRPVLIHAAGRLFLFNAPGRVLRIRHDPTAAEPFVLEATFTDQIPNADPPTRIWQDPAGRICIAHSVVRLAILFPGGEVPREIAAMMPASGE